MVVGKASWRKRPLDAYIEADNEQDDIERTEADDDGEEGKEIKGCAMELGDAEHRLVDLPGMEA